MTILTDRQIRQLANDQMIEPFSDYGQPKLALSGGLSTSGYDVFLGAHAEIAIPSETPIDPANFDERSMRPMDIRTDEDGGKYFLLPPWGFMLGHSVEYFNMPPDVVGFMTVKSTYARTGLFQPPTILEPEWEGHITIENVNLSPSPLKLPIGQGIAQVVFFKLAEIPERTYADKQGKYQGQTGVTFARGKIKKGGDYCGV